MRIRCSKDQRKKVSIFLGSGKKPALIGAQTKPTTPMKATNLIALAESKKLGISKKESRVYQIHRVVDGKHTTEIFHGKWHQFVSKIKSL